jgi:hypothetical protein
MSFKEDMMKELGGNFEEMGEHITITYQSGSPIVCVKAIVNKYIQNAMDDGGRYRRIENAKSFQCILPHGAQVPVWQDVLTDECGNKWSVHSVIDGYDRMITIIGVSDKNITYGNDRIDGR